MQPFSLRSFAKINWTLRVLGKRADGFHELFTVFQSVSLSDTVHFRGSEGLALTCDDPAVPTDGRNLIIQAAEALRQAAGIDHGATVHLEKRIPAPGGLGGGSSNAAAALVGLSRLWGLGLTVNGLISIAVKLGSDVPFFLIGGTAIGTGRGEIIEPAADIDERNILIVTPNISVSTCEAFEGLSAPDLTKEAMNRILPVCRSYAGSIETRRTELINDFEESVFTSHPEIRRVKETLIELGAVNAAMSGSGASVFAIFDNTETRQAAIKALDLESTWRKFAVATVSRDEYREALGL